MKRIFSWAMALALLGLLVVGAFLYPYFGIAPDLADTREFSDGKYSVLLHDLSYSLGETGQELKVPRGFVTDFASIPRLLWSAGLQPHGTYSRAAIIHDYLYWTQQCSREQSDNLLMIAMKESAVPKRDRRDIYLGVRLGGKDSWETNAKNRKAGVTKFVPETFLENRHEFSPWETLQPRLAEEGFMDPSVPQYRQLCHFGDKTDVPKAVPAQGSHAAQGLPQNPALQEF